MEWAAGMAITGVPNNPYPADIINLSLGGVGTCPTTSLYYPVIGTLAGMGVLVVASAGNSSGGAVDEPASCPGVLAVAGLRNVGTKVGYSSMGPQVSIAAPAGNCINSMGPCLRSIDTTVNTGLTVPLANVYTDQNNPNLGTSFSSPIVAGIVALMRAVNMNLTPAQLITRIKFSAIPFPAPPNIPVCPLSVPNTGECACPNDGSQCGAGMANALSAVNEALKPISVITNAGSNTLFDASGSVAACGLTVASYLWTAMGGIAIQGAADAAQVTVAWNGTTVGKLTLKVTDSAGHADNSATVTFDATGAASVHAPSGAGTAASACPTPLTFNAAAPTVSEAFSPASVGPNAASTLTITLTNTNGFALTQSAVTVPVPAGLSIQTMPAAATTCTGGLKTLTSTSGSVSLTGANIPAAGSCTITLSVMNTMAGTYAASIAANALTTGPAGSNAMSASASLNVTAPPGKSGGGGFAWLDVMFLAGVLLVKRTARL